MGPLHFLWFGVRYSCKGQHSETRGQHEVFTTQGEGSTPEGNPRSGCQKGGLQRIASPGCHVDVTRTASSGWLQHAFASTSSGLYRQLTTVGPLLSGAIKRHRGTSLAHQPFAGLSTNYCSFVRQGLIVRFQIVRDSNSDRVPELIANFNCSCGPRRALLAIWLTQEFPSEGNQALESTPRLIIPKMDKYCLH